MVVEEFVGYENLIAFMERKGLHNLTGDFVEIGAYMGGGTAKLAEYAGKYGKKVYAVDIFQAERDDTMGKGGVKAGDVYQAFLKGRSMLEAYKQNTCTFDNIVTIIGDSRRVTFPSSQIFVFGFIDGCHQASFVESDFRLLWGHMVSGGVVGLHDYKFEDWPEVTVAAGKILSAFQAEIAEAEEIEAGYGILSLMLTKK